MAGNVSYYIRLVDEFSAVAKRIMEASGAAAKSVSGFGNAANAAEKAMAGLAGNASKVAGAFEQSSRRVRESQRELELWAKQAAQVEKIEMAALARKQARENLIASGQIPDPSKKSRSWSSMASGAMGTIYTGEWMLGAIDKLVDVGGDLQTRQQKMARALGGGERGARLSEQALKQASAISIDSPNLSTSDVMHVIDDLRANLPAKFEEVLEKDVGEFAKLAEFFKSWQGGKHAGHLNDAMKDVNVAIQSGELSGELKGADLAEFIKRFAVMQTVLGTRFNASSFLAAQRVASGMFPGANNAFKFTDFPSLMQALGVRAGTGYATLMNKLIGGSGVGQGSAEYWRKLGLVDDSLIDYGEPGDENKPIKLDKKGRINTQTLKGQHWLLGNDKASSNLVDYAVQDLLPAAAREGKIRGLDANQAKELVAAFYGGDTDRVADMVKNINRGDLFAWSSALANGNQKAGQIIAEPILKLAAILRERLNTQKVYDDAGVNDVRALEDWNTAKQGFSKSMENLWLKLSGGTHFTDNMTAALTKFNGAAGTVAKFIDSHPMVSKGFQYGGTAAVATTALYNAYRALSLISRISGLQALARGINAVTAALTGTSAAAALKAAGSKLLGIGTGPLGLAGSAAATVVAGAASMTDDEYKRAAADAEAQKQKWIRAQNAYGKDVDVIGDGSGVGSRVNSLNQQHTNVRVDSNVTVQAPPSVKVEVDVKGLPSGMIGSGSGQLPLSATVGRGMAVQDGNPAGIGR